MPLGPILYMSTQTRITYFLKIQILTQPCPTDTACRSLKTEMRKRLAEQHRKAAYEALHGQPPPPPSSAAGGGCNSAAVDSGGGRNVTRDETDFNEYKCRSCCYSRARVK